MIDSRQKKTFSVRRSLWWALAIVCIFPLAAIAWVIIEQSNSRTESLAVAGVIGFVTVFATAWFAWTLVGTLSITIDQYAVRQVKLFGAGTWLQPVEIRWEDVLNISEIGNRVIVSDATQVIEINPLLFEGADELVEYLRKQKLSLET